MFPRWPFRTAAVTPFRVASAAGDGGAVRRRLGTRPFEVTPRGLTPHPFVQVEDRNQAGRSPVSNRGRPPAGRSPMYRPGSMSGQR